MAAIHGFIILLSRFFPFSDMTLIRSDCFSTESSRAVSQSSEQ